MPFTNSTDSSTSSKLITDIIEKVATNAPSEGDSTNLNISNFNLQDIIPQKPYYVYSNVQNDWIVFGIIDAIPLSTTTINTLQKIIQPFALPTPGDSLYYNSKGPAGLQIGDGIYISCKPTGSSKEETTVSYNKESTSFDFSNISDSPTFQYIITGIIVCIIFIVIFYRISAFYSYLMEEPIKLPNIQKMTIA